MDPQWTRADRSRFLEFLIVVSSSAMFSDCGENVWVNTTGRACSVFYGEAILIVIETEI